MKKQLLFVTTFVCCFFLAACGPKEENESREMEPATLKLKGSHAAWFKVEEPYLLRLVKTENDGWQVRIKVNLVKTKKIDTKRFQQALECCPEMAYMDDNDVELQEGQLSADYFNTLCAKEIGEPEELVLQPFSWHKMKYEDAKKIYDNLTSVVITDINIKKIEKSKSSRSSSSVFNDDDLDDAIDQYERALDAAERALDMLNEW